MCIKSEFKEICLKLATNSRSEKGFLLTSKVCPQGVFCPCPGAIYMYKIIKNVYKIRFRRGHLKLATYGQSDKEFLLTSKFCPQGVVCPCPRAIYMYKSIKIYTRTRCQVSVYRTTGPLVNTLKMQWQNFIKFGKHIDIHKMNIYNRKKGLRANSFRVTALCNS